MRKEYLREGRNLSRPLFRPMIAAIVAAFCCLMANASSPRNIILFIGDGMSTPQRMVAEEFSRKMGTGPLAMNAMSRQATTRTYSASSLVTDSAAAATAIACGEKTENGFVGLDPDGKRLTSCAEVARDAGKKVGIVTSVTINHATPAGFYAHQRSRSMLYEIGLDLVRSRFDLFMGGGLDGANAKTAYVAEYVGNLYDYAATNGYIVAEGREGFDALAKINIRNPRIWWRSGEKALPYAIDAEGDDTPRLPEITQRALDFLGDNFFLMVEGGAIDWAGHANEAATNLRDMLEFDDAIKVALEFQKTNPDTLVIVTGDHETGGMSMGFAGTGYAFYMERLALQKCSTEKFRDRFYDIKGAGGSFEDALALMEKWYGLKAKGDDGDPMVVSDKDMESLERHFEDGGFSDKVRRIMQGKAGVGWTSGSHTGLPALTTSAGPGSDRFTGLLDNTDIAKIIKELVMSD